MLDDRITEENVINNIAIIAFTNRNVNVSDRLKALELLGKYLGLFDPDEYLRRERNGQ